MFLKRLHFVLISLLLANSASSAADLALVHAKIYPSPTQRPIEGGTVLVRDGLIYAVGPGNKIKPPSGATLFDCQGLVIIAGFWNSHVHILTQGLMDAANLPSEQISAQLEKMLTRWGFTTVFDVASVLTNTNIIRIAFVLIAAALL